MGENEGTNIEKEIPSSAKKLKSTFNRIKGQIGGSREAVKAYKQFATDMGELGYLSQRALGIFYDKSMDPKDPNKEQAEKARKWVEDAIHICDRIIATFPQQIHAVMPVREKLKEQLADIDARMGKVSSIAGSIIPQDTLDRMAKSDILGDK